MNNDTSECESYKKILGEYLKDQEQRSNRRVLSMIFGLESNNNNREAEKKMKMDLSFQMCQFSKLIKIERDIEEIKDNQQAWKSQSNKPV